MSTEAQLRALTKNRSQIKGNVTRISNFFTKSTNVDLADIETRKVKLEENYQAFLKIQLEIDILIENAELEQYEDAQEMERAQFDEQYYACAKLINNCLHALSPRTTISETGAIGSESGGISNQNITIQQSNALLPKIEIRPFDGNPLEWYSFRDTFESLVHNDNNIPSVQKFHLLKNALQGNLTSIIESLNASEENYKVAWDLLKQRCDRPRQIIYTHIKSIFELPEIIKESPVSIRNLKEKALMHINALRALKEPVDNWDTILIYIIIQKLDKHTRRAWERTLENTHMPKLTELTAFLNKQERGEETEAITQRVNQFNSSRQGNKKANHRAHTFIGTQKQNECTFCKGSHYIYACETFLKLTPRERGKAARQKQLCVNCLRNNHVTSKCFMSGCKICNRKHNTLLHFTDYKPQIDTAECTQINSNSSGSNDQAKKGHALIKQISACSPSNNNINASLTVIHDSEVLLGTARVKILDSRNREHECRVLLDGGSQCHFISERLAEKLNLKQEKINLPFAGLGQLTTRSEYTVKTKIRSRSNKFESEVEFVALPTITGRLPSRQINKSMFEISRNIQLADPEFNKSAEIDALLGNTLFYKLLSHGQIKVNEKSDLILQKTLLGWIVTGEVKMSQGQQNMKMCNFIASIDDQLARFWQVEELPNKKHLSAEESECEKIYAKTTIRDTDGRYIVQLPFNDKKKDIGNSYTMALKRVYTLERKLYHEESLKQSYHDALRDYQNLGHMTEITDTDNKYEGYYIPHQAVVKENNLTTKVRVVFDASAKSATKISLNDALMVGPTIQDELIFILMRFRLYNVVLAADLQKMYRQIKVNNSDANFQKILWRENTNEPIRVFKLNTVTQGTASAPYLAAKTLHQLADDEGHRFPLAAASLKHNFYVDDLLAGAATIEQALELKSQLIQLLKLGGFELHKWASNKSELMSESEDISIKPNKCLDVQTRKLLGIHWDAMQDTITYSINPLPLEKRVTKRIILSQIAQLFDPLGILGPVIVVAKLIMQALWKAKLDWDESIPQSLHTKWLTFKNELHSLTRFKIARQIIVLNATDIQLHGFCDASERAYGACVYIRSMDKFNNSLVQLVCAKSRIAPVSTMTLPRLELCAALLLAKLMKTISEALKLNYNAINYFSDSTIVLHWIKTSPHSLKTFVANRVAEIQALTNVAHWYHISTEENPADYISRGQTPTEFLVNRHWFHGPTWLSQDENKWNILQLSNVEIPDQRMKTALLSTKNQGEFNNEVKNDTLERFSSFNSLIKFIAFCHRAVINKRSDNKLKGKYTIDELKNAHLQLIKLIQHNHFIREIKNLTAKKELSPKSKILCLNPFLDSDGIIRVGGRLTNATVTYSRKYPILLPRSEHVTNLIIRNEHIKYWHAGVQATLNSVRQTYWPVDGKTITRREIHRCVRCSKLNPKLPKYIMGDLPKNRVTQSRPFDNVGLDYCGPFLLKEKKFRNKTKVKSYVAVFVCYTTRAVNLELVTDLTTETCLEAIKRFIARRGKPKNLYSDNATNFIGAKNEILKVRAFLLSNESNSKISHFFQNEGINWHFSPPRSPHFGGLWEAAVRSFKHHLYRTVGDSMFTYEQFNTCIVQIESILNSRPLTPLSSDPNDLIAITPAHFLIGDCLTSIPEYDLQDEPINRLSMWQRIQRIKQHFWQRWHKEYLNELRTRSKWHQGDGTEIKIGTLVMIKEDNVPPMHWNLGRIVAVHPGADNIVRVATVKTQHGTYKRCVKKLSPLPIDIDTHSPK